MALGIDPKNDYAFKCVFGSERHTRVLIHMLNAVLKPRSERRVDSVVILNPMSEPVVLDELMERGWIRTICPSRCGYWRSKRP